MNTRNEFADRLLTELEIPIRRKARLCLVGWMMAESGDNACNGNPGEGAKYNPLNTTLSMGSRCDVSDYNSTGVKNYASEGCGVRATASTLLHDRYRDIRRQLGRVYVPGWRKRFADAVGNSEWGTSSEGVLAGINAAESSAKWGNLTVG